MAMNVQWAIFWSNILLGIITLIAVYVALNKEDIRKPIVKIGFGNDTPYTIDNYLTPYGRLFRIKVVNLGKPFAKNCQVKLLSVKSEDGENVLDKDEPDILKWSDAPRDMNYRQDDWTWVNKDPDKLPPIFREKKDITPKGGSELCDLFYVDGNKNIIFSSSGGRKFICEKEKRYFALIEIHGDNFKPTIKEIEIYTPFKIEKDLTVFTAGVVGVRNISQ